MKVLSGMAALFLILLVLSYQPNAKIYIFDRYGLKLKISLNDEKYC